MLKTKNVQKIVSVLLIAIFLVTISSSVFAATGLTPSDFSEGTAPTGGKIETVGKSIIGILQAVGIVISVIVLIIIGIKYMMGSASEKAEYKKVMIPYVVGAALIFAASAFAQVAYDFFTGIA